MPNKSINIIILVFLFISAACETKTDPDFGKPPQDEDSAISQGDSGIDAKTDSSEAGTGGTIGGDSGGVGGTSGSGGIIAPTTCDDDADCPGQVCDIDAGECAPCVREGEVSRGCLEPLPVCATAPNPADNHCEECVSDSDCPEAKPVCDPTRLACAPCAKDDNGTRGCPDENTPICRRGTLAENNECVQCIDDDDCDEGVCDSVGDDASYKCVECIKTDEDSHGCESSGIGEHCLKDEDDPTKSVCVECLEHGDCEDPKESVCSDNECWRCQTDDDCERLDETPACDSAKGCVECTDSEKHCPQDKPVCESRECRKCTSHGDCDFAGGLCEMATGRCYQRDEVIFVDSDRGECPSDDGVEPFCELQTAMAYVGYGTNAKRVIRVEGSHAPTRLEDRGEVLIIGIDTPSIGGEANVPALEIINDTDLTIVGFEIANAYGTGKGIWCSGDTETTPLLTVRDSIISDNGTHGIATSYCALTVEDTTIRDNGGVGVYSTNGTITLEGNEITSNTGGGVSTSGGTVTLEDNEITSNPGGGVLLVSCDYQVTNNVIAGNGSSTLYGGVRITSPGSTSALFHSNTVVGNFAEGTNEAGVKCDDEAYIDSSIVFGNLSTGTEVSANCIPNFSLIEDGSGDQSETEDNNLTGDPSFISASNYHLETEEPDRSRCINAGQDSPLVTRDIDGNVRPQGGRSDMGAYEAM